MEGLALKKRLLGTIPEVRAPEAKPDIGLLLPCNGVLRQEGEALIQDPQGMFALLPQGVWERPGSLPEEARARLERALAQL
ncbi:MAG: hypothetical protein ACO2OU_02150 [Thermus aquaticus]|jgi:hypothetical protein|uniref:hypothetical protein n=1 Tax=Thermus aquaticus TaxID=271 RepID=UPI003C0CE92A